MSWFLLFFVPAVVGSVPIWNKFQSTQLWKFGARHFGEENIELFELKKGLGWFRPRCLMVNHPLGKLLIRDRVQVDKGPLCSDLILLRNVPFPFHVLPKTLLGTLAGYFAAEVTYSSGDTQQDEDYRLVAGDETSGQQFFSHHRTRAAIQYLYRIQPFYGLFGIADRLQSKQLDLGEITGICMRFRLDLHLISDENIADTIAILTQISSVLDASPQ